jgi:predicted HAD superfamily phosphohydrolase YqeG
MPDLFVDSIMDIPLELLTRKNTKGIIFDLDNTVTEWNNPEIKHEILQCDGDKSRWPVFEYP